MMTSSHTVGTPLVPGSHFRLYRMERRPVSCMQSRSQSQHVSHMYQQLSYASAAINQLRHVQAAWRLHTVDSTARQPEQVCRSNKIVLMAHSASTAAISSVCSTAADTSNTSASESDVSSSMCDDIAALNSSHLQAYISAHTDLHSVQLVRDAGKQLMDPDVIKSLLILVAGRPHIVVLRGVDKLDLKKVAICSSVAKRQVRLARHCETVQLCGFVPGTVPPLGHASPLSTLVDTEVAQLAGLLYAGGGDHDVEMVLDVATLLQHTRAKVADVAAWSAPATVPTLDPSAAAAAAVALTPTPAAPTAAIDGSDTEGASAGSTTRLPLPWPPGSQQVELTGMVAARRRVAKLLQFCMLVPPAAHQPAGQVSYIRRAWANPMQQETGGPDGQARCEVQLIMGKTLERKLGRDAAIQLLDSIRPGVMVRVQGTVQPHGPPADYHVPPPRSKTAASMAAAGKATGQTSRVQDHGSGQPSASQQGHTGSVVLDVVIHHVEVLPQDSADNETHANVDQRHARHSPASQHDSHDIDAPLISSEATYPLAAQSGAVEVSEAQGIAEHSSDHQQDRPYWMGPHIQVHWVDSLPSLTYVRQYIRHCIAEQARQRTGVTQAEDSDNHSDSTTNSILQAVRSHLPVPVGLDCEWVPYIRDQQPTPVALMQIAFRDRVFLVDMLAVTAAETAGEQQQPPHDSRHPDTDAPHASTSGTELSSMQDELGALLQDIFMNPDVTALGFQLNQDLKNLARSYPFLLAFLAPCAGNSSNSARQEQTQLLAQLLAQQPQQHLANSKVVTSVNGVTYVDVLKLARAARPEQFLLSFGRPPAMSLSSVVKEVFGFPLDKTYQRSDWAARPLSAGQAEYAAADATSLVALHDALLLPM